TLIDLTYRLDNGISINSQSAYVDFDREANADSSNQPFADSNQYRITDHQQHSQQLRIEGPSEGYDVFGGGVNMNFMVGAFYQQWDKDVTISNIRGIFRRGQRFNNIWEDAEFKSAFWGVDFKFMNEQLSVQVGGRYSDVHKEVFLQGYGAALIFDEVPCDSDGTDIDPATCTPDPDFKRVDPTLTEYSVFDPTTGNGDFGSRPERAIRIDSPRIYLPGVDMTNLWTHNLWRVRTPVPLNYRGAQEQAVGLTAPVYENRNGPFGPCEACAEEIVQDADDYSTQIVISFTPDGFDGNHTLYGKFVEGFKGPVTDTGTSTLPSDLNDVFFGPEFAESWELGIRGSVFDGRGRYGLTGFKTKFNDLQSQVAVSLFDPDDRIDQQGVSLNAGEQKVDGVELNFDWAVTQNLVVNLASSVMDA
ncbi:MAG: TonB-dependent receptor, partial [Pseudohongiellaceae bacterium]